MAAGTKAYAASRISGTVLDVMCSRQPTIRDCAAGGAQLVVLPEGFLEGYVVNQPELTAERFRELAEPLDGPYVNRFRLPPSR